MAEALARLVKFPWTAPNNSGDGKGTYKGFLSMKLGTFKYLFPLGLPAFDPESMTTTSEVKAKTYKRYPYPGCEPITVIRPAQKITRTLTARVSTAVSENKLILSERGVLGASQDTVHYTGKVHGAVAFLSQFADPVAGGGVAITGPHGQSYGQIEAVTVLPAP
jgi:hypothetical protein